jgi:hypothetical protein
LSSTPAPILRSVFKGSAMRACPCRIGDVEAGVGHADRIENGLLEGLIQRFSRHDLDQPPENVGRMAVVPGGAGLERERQPGEAVDEFGIVEIAVVTLASR